MGEDVPETFAVTVTARLGETASNNQAICLRMVRTAVLLCWTRAEWVRGFRVVAAWDGAHPGAGSHAERSNPIRRTPQTICFSVLHAPAHPSFKPLRNKVFLRHAESNIKGIWRQERR